MLCASVGVAHACVVRLDAVTRWVTWHVTPGERPEAGVNEEGKECPSLQTWGVGQLWGPSPDLGQRRHLHWRYLPSP